MINNLFAKVKEHHFIINLIVLALLYFVNTFWQGIVFVIAPYLLIIAFMEGKLKGFYYLSFSVAFVCIFKLGTNIYLLLIIGAIYILATLIYNLVKEHKTLNKPLLIMLGVMLAYLLLPLHAYTTMLFVKIFVIVMLFLVLEFFMLNKEDMDIKLLFWTFALGIIVSSVYGLFYSVSPYLKSCYTIHMYDTFPRFSGLIEHPNSFAMICMICVAMLAYLLLTYDSKIFTAILLGLVTIIPIFTLSKAYLLIVTLCYGLMWLMFTKKHPKQGFILLGIGMVGLIVFYAIFHSIINAILGRFISSFIDKNAGFNLDQITTGRTELWVQYMSQWISSPYNIFFGFGLNAVRPFRESVHNVFLSALYEMGIVGFILFFTVLVYEIVRFIKPKNTKFHLSALLPLLVTILYCLSEDFIFYLFI